MRWSRTFAAALVLASAPWAQQLGVDPAARLVGMADANRDGDIAAEEWAAFVSGLEAAEDGTLDRHYALGLVVFEDLDRDGRYTVKDVELGLGPVTEDGANTPSGRSGGITRVFLRALADADGSGGISQAEADALYASAQADAEGVIGTAARAEWVRRIEAMPPPPENNRGAMVPPVILAGFLPALDADANGRLSLDDANALHRMRDANGDGLVTAAELATRPTPADATGAGRGTGRRVGRGVEPLMPWQRSLEDALALVERTGKPLLICVNLDGESASESLAFRRYRDPEFVALASGFIPVLASPTQRELRERDDRGRRLPDRRFGRLLNAEHINIEPQLFERYFNGQRVAPRHVGVSPEGEILFDLFLLQDLSIIDRKLAEFTVQGEAPPSPDALTDEQLLWSPDALHREALEARFVAADEDQRVMLAGLALSAERSVQHPELVYLALRDPSPAVRRAAVATFGAVPAATPVDLISAAFAVAAGDAQLEAGLLAALEAIRVQADADGDTLRRGDVAYHQRVFRGLTTPCPQLDPVRWATLLHGAPAIPHPTVELDVAGAELGRLDEALRESPQDTALLLRRLEWLTHLARAQLASGGNPTFALEDAAAGCEEVLGLSPGDGRALGLQAWCYLMTARFEEAATSALAALPQLDRDAGTALAADTLYVLANARTRQLYSAIGANEAWPDEWVSQAHAAYQALVAHPLATEEHWTGYLDLLVSLRATGVQAEVVRRALASYPASERLHSYLRFQTLRDAGSRALEASYEADPLDAVDEGMRPTVDWYQGLASLVAAEHDVNNRDAEAAAAAYRRADEHFARSAAAAPGFAGSASHYRCLALAGLSRLQAAGGQLEQAVTSLVDGVRLAPTSAEQADGLGRTPLATARELRGSLRAAGQGELVSALESGLAEAGFAIGD